MLDGAARKRFPRSRKRWSDQRGGLAAWCVEQIGAAEPFLVAAREAEPSLMRAVACGLIVLGAVTATWASQRMASA